MKNGKLLIAPSMLWLGFFFIIPMLIVVAVSFAARTPYGQVVFNWNINNYLRFLEPLYLSIFAQTLLVALVTTVVTILMGYPLAYYIAQLPKRWQQPGLILCMIPFWINSGPDPLHDSLLDQLPDPLVCVGHHPAGPGRAEHISDEGRLHRAAPAAVI